MTRHRLLTALACAASVVAASGCTGDPAPAPSPSPTGTSSPLAALDTDREALEGMLAELDGTLTALRTELEAAATGDEAALGAAAELLAADVTAVTDADLASASATGSGDDAAGGDEDADAGDAEEGAAEDTDGSGATPDPDPDDDADATPPTVDLDGPAPILPGPLVSREESIEYGDLLTRTLAAARGAGSAGEQAQRFLADPLAGDLGAWQRAPDDQLEAIARAGSAGDLDATEAAVLELEGEAPRALAWVVHGLAEPSSAADAAGRALAHLAIIELALDQLE